jgi:hypothetical protein
MRRSLAGIAGLAASVSIGSLVLAEKTTTGQGHRVAVVFLFMVFLAALFTLLAVAIVDSDHGVERLSEVHEVSPRWSLRRARRRLGERLARVAREGVTGVARVARNGLTAVAETLRAVVALVRREFEPEQRRVTHARLKERWYAALVVMGMPPKALEEAIPPSAPASGHEETELTSTRIAALRAVFAARSRGTGPGSLGKVRPAPRPRFARARPHQERSRTGTSPARP